MQSLVEQLAADEVHEDAQAAEEDRQAKHEELIDGGEDVHQLAEAGSGAVADGVHLAVEQGDLVVGFGHGVVEVQPVDADAAALGGAGGEAEGIEVGGGAEALADFGLGHAGQQGGEVGGGERLTLAGGGLRGDPGGAFGGAVAGKDAGHDEEHHRQGGQQIDPQAAAAEEGFADLQAEDGGGLVEARAEDGAHRAPSTRYP